MRPFRFGYQIRCPRSAGDLITEARAAEEAGFDVVHTWDHVVGGPDGWSPLAPLTGIAAATTRIRVGPLVLNNDFHHPVHLAREIATIDHLSGGRVELGIGAGHSFPEYEAIGQAFDPPRVRKARLAEAVEIIRELLAGHVVTFDGEHYQLDGVRTMKSAQSRVPILVGVNGKTALTHAAHHADIIGLTMFGRTLEDGNRHEARWEPARIDTTIEHIRSAAADRWNDLELNALVQAVAITDDRNAAAADLASRVPGLTAEEALVAPFLALGTHRQIADHLLRCRERWAISYYSVRDIESFAPVIEILRDHDSSALGATQGATG